MKKLYYLLFALIVFFNFSCNNTNKYQYHEGFIQGTTFHIKYENTKNLNPQIDSLLNVFNKYFSNYDTSSLISKINNNLCDTLNPIMEKLLNASFEINSISNGAFDITIAPIANLWKFGWEKDSLQTIPTKEKIDSLLNFVGMDKISINDHRLIKKHPNVKIIVNAIAQGFSCDFIAEYFDKINIKNYIIEIGGEIYCKGINPNGKKWAIGITKPEVNNNNESALIVNLQDCAICTSGNYRKFVMDGKKKYGHSINPKTGYPAVNSLLSVSVISNYAVYADALATAFMVLGLERSLEIVDSLKNTEAIFIYLDENKIEQIKYSENFEEKFSE